MLIQRLSSLSVWDDAYMFVRYADNLLSFGNLSWNPNDVNTYGLTSLAYLMMVVPLRLVFTTEPAVVMILSSLLSGLLALISLIRLLNKLIADGVHRLVMWILFALMLVIAGDSITLHLTSGMDTMFTIWMLVVWVGYLYLSDNYLLMGLLGGIFFMIRPDVLILVCAVSLGLLFSRISHSQLTKYGMGVGFVIVIHLLFTSLYFGNPLPLSFHAKNLPLYSSDFYSYYNNSTWTTFINFIATYIYWLGIILMSIITDRKNWRWQDKSLLLGSVLFCVYHILFVVPIMGFGQRFFYPIAIVLFILVARKLPYLLDSIPQRYIRRFLSYPLRILFIPVLLLLGVINPLPIILTLGQYMQPNDIPMIGVGRFDLQSSYVNLYTDNWYRLDELSTLDDDIVIATTEVGLPAAMNPNKRIIDLAGLNQARFALSGFDADWLMESQNQPDWIYMPFPHYVGMWTAIADHPAFKVDYDIVSAQSLNTAMDVAIRRDSAFYLDMLEILIDDG